MRLRGTTTLFTICFISSSLGANAATLFTFDKKLRAIYVGHNGVNCLGAASL